MDSCQEIIFYTKLLLLTNSFCIINEIVYGLCKWISVAQNISMPYVYKLCVLLGQNH